ncbi:glyoxylate reductase hydroxypyruvate reductase-like [Brachionus plicatilis]|uniref:Glyoxylate reductase/hydroxypyruvate reductase n=1 Tax=Brachionus plicatilis TaxID=10195 RepID=A0A3M7RRX0_BRAPC|nr:glyoxylate reductase hydroxypyruvate reductase-like [Brachionus plicatilis]
MNEKLKVFVTLPFDFEDAHNLLSNSGFEVIINEELPLDRSSLLRKARGCHGIICYPTQNIDKEFLNFVGNQLKVVCTNSVGYNHIDLKECSKLAVAEFAIGLLLNVSRKISEGIEFYKKNDLNAYWTESFLLGKSLEGSTVGILGLGRIGLCIAARLKGFDVKKIIYHNRHRSVQGDELGFELVEFEELLTGSDFLICSCSLNKESKNIFNKKAFEKMKPSAIFVNVSRGECVDQDELYEVLKENKILAAGLDVTIPYLLAKEHKLFSLENCFITPYISSAEENCRLKMSVVTAKNLINGLNGQNLLYPLEFHEE